MTENLRTVINLAEMALTAYGRRRFGVFSHQREIVVRFKKKITFFFLKEIREFRSQLINIVLLREPLTVLQKAEVY